MSHSGSDVFDPAFWHRHWADAVQESEGSLEPPALRPPNPYTLSAAASVPTGSVLDAGSGAGAGAIALARQGWRVTAVDTSPQALQLAATHSRKTDLAGSIEWIEADITQWQPGGGFDLVTCSHVHTSLPQPELLQRLAGWVNPLGSLVMVGHAPGHHDADEDHPPESATNAREPLHAALDRAVWQVTTQTHTRSVPRGEGRAKTLHDVVLWARRHVS